jgi:FecR-like protein
MFKLYRFALLFAGALFALGAVAQPAPDDNDQADPPSRVARLAFIRGTVSFVPAGENDWVEAQLNRPLITGDKLWTDHDSRAELEIGSSALRLDAETSFDFLNLDDQTAQIELTQGSLNLRVRRLYDNQVYEVDTPTLAFVINRVGEYRLTVLPNGRSTVVAVLQGGGDAYGEDGARSRIEEG